MSRAKANGSAICASAPWIKTRSARSKGWPWTKHLPTKPPARMRISPIGGDAGIRPRRRHSVLSLDGPAGPQPSRFERSNSSSQRTRNHKPRAPRPPVHPSLASAGNGVVENSAWVEDQNVTLGIHSDTMCGGRCITVRSQIAMADQYPILNIGVKPEMNCFVLELRLWHGACITVVIASTDE